MWGMDTNGQPRVDALLREARRRIDPADAELLLAYALDRPRAWLFAHAGDALSLRDAGAFAALVERREAGEPVAYLTGRRGFWTLELDVDASVLVPRADTERLVELALERLPADRDLRIADLGTGSGAIALALASERPRARVVATDASAAALGVAARNAARLGLHSVVFRRGDWCAPLDGERYHLIASNPPYIAQDDPHLRAGDLRFEPPLALSSGQDGLDAIREIAARSLSHLVPEGWLLLEHGWEQGEAVRALLHEAGFVEVATHRDIEGRDRVTLGRTPA